MLPGRSNLPGRAQATALQSFLGVKRDASDRATRQASWSGGPAHLSRCTGQHGVLLLFPAKKKVTVKA